MIDIHRAASVFGKQTRYATTESAAICSELPRKEHPLRTAVRTRQRVFSLDVLRGVAAILVLLRHLPPTNYQSTDFLERLVQKLHNVGWVGVDLFFVLSGVLISCLIYNELDNFGSFAPVRFLLRRGLKIWPAYFAAYGTVTALRYCAETVRGRQEAASEIATSAIWNSLFLQNYIQCQRWPHSWSIAVEEHFYTGLALLTFLFVVSQIRTPISSRTILPSIVALWVAAATIAFVLRVRISYPNPNWEAVYYPTHLRLDALLFGVMLGGIFWVGGSNQKPVRERYFSLLAIFGTITAFMVPALLPLKTSSLLHCIGFPIIYLGFGCTVAWAAFHPDFGRKSPFLMRHALCIVAWIGGYSYTIYLAHAVIFMIPGVEGVRQLCLSWGSQFLNESVSVWFDRVAFWFASIAGGYLLGKLVERPTLRLRERWLPSRRPAHDVQEMCPL